MRKGKGRRPRKEPEQASPGRSRAGRKLPGGTSPFFEEARDAIFFTDPETGLILDVNREAERLTGRPRRRLIGAHYGILHPPEEAERYRTLFIRHAVLGGGISGEAILLTRAGRRVPVEIFSGVVAYGRNRRAVQTVFRDLTRKPRAQDPARMAAREWQITFDALTDAVCVLDTFQRVQRCNRATLELLKKDAADVIGHPCHKLYHDGKPPDECPFRKMLASRKRETMELPAGDRLYRVSVDPILDPEGRIIGGVHVLRDITDLMTVQESLRRERDLARKYLEVAGVAIVALDASGRVASVNRKACELLGGTEADLLGRDWFETFLPAAARAETRAVFDRLLSGAAGPSEEHESLILTLYGEERRVAWSNTVLRDASGRISGTLSSGQDVTAIRQMEDLIRIERDLNVALASTSDLNEGLKACLDAALRASGMDSGGIYRVDPDSRSMNLVAAQGLSEAFVREASHYESGHPLLDLVLAGRVVCRPYRFFLEGAGQELTPARKAEGLKALAVIPIRLRGRSVACLNAASHTQENLRRGQIEALLTMATHLGNALARLEAEDALRRSEARHRRTMEMVREGIWTLDAGGRTVYANPRLVEMLGTTPGEIGGTSLAAFMGETEAGEFRRALETSSMEAGVERESELIRRDGKRLAVLIRATPHRDAEGRYAGAVATVTDLAEKRRLEEQIRQAQKMEAVGRLAGGIAHDFNNLLTAISGYAHILREGLPPDDSRRSSADEILRSSQKAADLTRKLLAFGRKQILKPQVLNLNDIVSSMEKLLRRVIGENVELVTSLAPTLGRVRADPGQIEQVILNLAINARDAMPEGGRLYLETRNATPDPGAPASWVELSVRDTGVGMSDEIKSHLFEPFFTTKGPGQGTGLGLSIVHGIIEQSGGRIEVASRPGEGSTFRILLPLVEEPLKAPAAPPPAAVDARGTETILLVEDAPVVLSLGREILRSRGYLVLEASSGPEAIRKMEGHPGPIHLLVTDLVMPGMSGRELAVFVSAARPGIRVLYMSGYAEDAVALQGKIDPRGAFIPKPFTPTEFARKVREVLDAPRPAPAPPHPGPEGIPPPPEGAAS